MPRLTEKLRHFVQQETCPVSDACIPGFASGAEWGWGSARNRVGAMLKNFPEANIPDSAICFFRDGDRWCCVNGDFIDIQSSPAGFGETFDEALEGLRRQFRHTHVNSGIKGDDSCKRCGHDLRHQVHMAKDGPCP